MSSTRFTPIFAAALLLAACGGRPAKPVDPNQPATPAAPTTPTTPSTPSTPSTPAKTPLATAPSAPTQATPLQPTQPGLGERCDAGRDIDLIATWTGLSAYQGKRVVFFTTRSLASGSGDVRVSALVRGDSATVSCQNALVEETNYPGLGVFVDLDGNGRCDAGEPVGHTQFYAWINNHKMLFEHQGQGVGQHNMHSVATLCALANAVP